MRERDVRRLALADGHRHANDRRAQRTNALGWRVRCPHRFELYRDVWRRLPTGGRGAIVTRNQAYERAAKHADIKFVSIEDYQRFRDVGLRGLAIDGTERAGARDRNGARNALFADLPRQPSS